MPEPLDVWRCRYCSRVYESRDDCIEHMKTEHVKCPYCGQYAGEDKATGGRRCKQCGAKQVMENGVMCWRPA